MMKRLLTLLIAAIILLTSALPLSADSAPLYIKTPEPPAEVTSYALEVFSGIKRSDIKHMHVYDWMLDNPTLAPGFMMYNSHTELFEENAWHFPIKAYNKIFATLTVNSYGGRLSFQITQGGISDALSKTTRNSSKYVVSLNANKPKVVTQNTDIESYVNLSENIAQTPEGYDGEKTVKLIETVHCDITVIDGIGTCWASTVASITAYRNRKLNPYAAKTLRDEIVELKKEKTDTPYGTLTNCCTYLSAYIVKDYKLAKAPLSFDEITHLIDSDSPSIIAYTQTESNLGHAAVLCGYTKIGGKNAYMIMDPNYPESGYFIVEQGGIYSPNMMVYDNSEFIAPQYSWTSTGADMSLLKELKTASQAEKGGSFLPLIAVGVIAAGLIVARLFFKPKKLGGRYI